MANQDPDMSGSHVMQASVPVPTDRDHALVPAQPMPSFAAPMAPPAPQGNDVLNGPFDQTWLVNCVRRRWLLALSMGALMGGLTAGLLLILFPESSSVTAYLQVQSKPTRTILGEEQRMTHQEFEVFQQTQLALLRSHFVLTSALTRSDISQLDAVNKEADPVQWLIDEMKVRFPGQGEILEIRYDGEEKPEELVKIVDAVIAAYQAEVLQKEAAQQYELRERLVDLHKEVQTELEEKMIEYEKLARQVGGLEYSPTAATEVNLLTREISIIIDRINKTKEELVNLEVTKAVAVQQFKSPAAIDAQVEEALAADPTIAQYEEERFFIDQRLRELMARSKRPTPEAKNLQVRSRQLASELENYRMQAEQQMRSELKNSPSGELSAVMTEYVMRRNEALQRLKQLEEELVQKKEEVSEMGASSSSLAIMQNQIDQERELEREMDLKIRSWDVEENAGQERIRVMQNATASEKINSMQRYAIAAIGGVAAFCATGYGVALLEFQRRRLNGAKDVEGGLGVRVLGVLPPVPSVKSLAPGNITAAQVSEAIDNVRATLLHDTATRGHQVILITSPATMEGCTTVASHLALSITRSGRRTLLVDGDLRSPSLHKLFGMPLEDGLSEVLRSEIDLADALRPTSTEGLWMLSAGHCDMDAIHALATDQPQPIFEKLREEFDFVIIDGAPVLGISDTVSLGQHCDGVVLTVLRDHSEVRKIHQSLETLRSMGVRVLGSVVNGVRQRSDRRVTQIHQAAAQRNKQLAQAKKEA